MTATNVVTESASVSATWLGSRPHQASSRLHPGLDLTTVTTTNAVSVERTMNQQERDELRENHRRDGVLGCWTCQDYAWNDEYPCDVIRVLDVLEEVLAQVNAPIEVDPSGWEAAPMKAKPECDEHPKDIIFIDSDFQEAEADYCPKCGEKL